MKITKIGHCCLLLEVDNRRILTDPGVFSTAQTEVKDLDLILITHEHADHFHIDSLKTVLQNNPNVEIITNKSVGKLLDAENIKYTVIEDGQNQTVKDILVEGFGEKHAFIYGSMPDMQNTGYFVQNKFFFPGDALINPGKPVDILALPIVAPWLKFSEAVDYAKEIKPRVSFPVHDAILNYQEFFHKMHQQFLEANSVHFIIPEIGKLFEA